MKMYISIGAELIILVNVNNIAFSNVEMKSFLYIYITDYTSWDAQNK